MVQVASETRGNLEDVLMLPSWGLWARPRIDRELGAKAAGWTTQIEEGYKEEPEHYVPPIEEDYAEVLDALMCALLSNHQKDVLVEIYVRRMPIKIAAKRLKSTIHKVRQERDIATGCLYGALQYRLYKK